MRLLFLRLLQLQVTLGAGDFILDLLAGPLEFKGAAAQSAGQFRQLLGPEQDQDHHEDDQQLRSARKRESKYRTHNEDSLGSNGGSCNVKPGFLTWVKGAPLVIYTANRGISCSRFLPTLP